MAIETLLLREHNRVCDLLVAKYPDWDDDKLYNFARIAMSTKYQMIANLYQQAYFTNEMPKPRWGKLSQNFKMELNSPPSLMMLLYSQMDCHYSVNGTVRTCCS